MRSGSEVAICDLKPRSRRKTSDPALPPRPSPHDGFATLHASRTPLHAHETADEGGWTARTFVRHGFTRIDTDFRRSFLRGWESRCVEARNTRSMRRQARPVEELLVTKPRPGSWNRQCANGAKRGVSVKIIFRVVRVFRGSRSSILPGPRPQRFTHDTSRKERGFSFTFLSPHLYNETVHAERRGPVRHRRTFGPKMRCFGRM